MFSFFEDTTAGASKSQLSAEEMNEFGNIINKIESTNNYRRIIMSPQSVDKIDTL